MEGNEFWRSMASKFGVEASAVNMDITLELENRAIESVFTNKYKQVCDLGCGNGLTTLYLARKFPETTFFGYDYVSEMIESANSIKNKEGIQNAVFAVMDATKSDEISTIKYKYDLVITKRLLINVKGENKQLVSNNVYDILKNNGEWILIECFEEPLKKINEIRKLLELAEIKQKDFNEYLNQKSFNDIINKFEIISTYDFQSFYYFVSRTFNAKMSVGDPNYNSEINKIAIFINNNFPNILSGFSPQYMIHTRKK